MQERVHITCCALVLESDVTRFLLRVITTKTRRQCCELPNSLISPHFTKLCHNTPVGSFKTRTNTLTSAHSSSIVGRDCPSCGWNSFRSSLNRVKPQSHSSAMKRWCASDFVMHEVMMKNVGHQSLVITAQRWGCVPARRHSQMLRPSHERRDENLKERTKNGIHTANGVYCRVIGI